MTINRIIPRPRDEPDEAPRAGTYWELRTERFVAFCIDARTAQRILALLGRWWAPRWITFRDVAGSQVRVRRGDIRSLVESTPTTRAADRRLEVALEAEEREQRPPWMEGL